VEYNLDDATVEDESPDERDAKGQTWNFPHHFPWHSVRAQSFGLSNCKGSWEM
jgi:hypothetical protein